MKRLVPLFASILLWLSAAAAAPAPFVWHGASLDSSGSMPVGGGSAGLNLWVEDGDILFYIGRSGAYDENNTLLKLGRVRISLPPQPGATFTQTLNLNEGYATVSYGDVEVKLWSNVFAPVVQVEIRSKSLIAPRVSYETWRHRDRPFRKGEGKQSSWKWSSRKDLHTAADSVSANGNSVTFYHKNAPSTVFDATVSAQGLDSVKHLIPNPLAGLTSGGVLTGANLKFAGTSLGEYMGTDFKAYKFDSKPARSHTLSIIHFAEPNPDFNALTANRFNLKKEAEKSRRFWREAWQRSYIEAPAEADTTVQRMARNYTLFRYMLLCNAFGSQPTKFNGGLFTFDPLRVKPDSPFTPDYRNWGGGTMTAQNQRLVYWPMFAAGDAAMVEPQLRFYLDMLPVAELRSRVYWGHAGGCFTEQTEQFGLPNLMEYGSKRPAGYDPGVEYNAWLEYSWDTVLEFCSMALAKRRYLPACDISAYRPLIESALTFFDEHYQLLASRRGVKKLDGSGSLVIFPGSGCETYKMALNPASTVAGLQSVADDYILYLKEIADTAALARWQAFRSRVPAIPMRVLDGRTLIAPAKSWERVNNVESPQLYPVWPWRIYGVAVSDSADLQIARNTYLYDPDALKFRSPTGWKQDNIWAACLGLSDEAFALTSAKLANGPHRFPAFFGPGFDWTPDHNHGGSAMIGLQEMLMQTDGESIRLFPAWPLNRDISFRLHAPGNKAVAATLRGGVLTELSVTPASPELDIILPDGIKISENIKQ